MTVGLVTPAGLVALLAYAHAPLGISALGDADTEAESRAQLVVDAGVYGLATDEIDVSDEKISIEQKRDFLLRLNEARLIDELGRVQPATARSILCQEWAELATGRQLRVESVDANGEAVKANLRIDGAESGETPKTVVLAPCARRLEVQRANDGNSQSFVLGGTTKRTIRADWGGPRTRWSLSPIVDFTVFDPPARLVPPGSPTAAAMIGSGVRLEKWSTLFHGSIALIANPLFGPLVQAQALPSIDLFAGMNFRPGNDVARAVISGQIGLWNLVQPAARLTLGFMLFERLLFTTSADLRFMLAPLVFTWLQQYFRSAFVLGLSSAIGFCW